MSTKRNLPPTASFAEASEDGRLFAPSAAKNIDPIADVLEYHAPKSGTALEIASGTGQHVAILAKRIPHLQWYPSDIDPERRASVDAWAKKSGQSNIAPAIDLDATAKGWSLLHGGHSLITLTNLMHLISEDEAKTVIAEVGRALAPQGIFHLYGPFLRDGETTSVGDAEFHAKLRAADPEIGYKDDWDVIDWIHASGMDLVQVFEMPSNNMSFVATRPF